jgi:fumarate reductase subunit D
LGSRIRREEVEFVLVSGEALFEAADWSLFTFGAFVAAFILPAQIIITLILRDVVPRGVLASFPLIPLAKLYLFLVLGVAAWHGMHRIRFVLFDVGLSHHRRPITAIAIVVLVAILVWAFIVLFLQ